MAQCNFDIPFPGEPDELLAIAKKSIVAHKGTFAGDTSAGNFTLPLAIGDIEGSYTIADEVICITITKKPMLVTCKMIEKQLIGYLKPPATV